MLNRFFVAALALAGFVGIALAQGPGPGPVPTPWTVNGSAVSTPGCVLVPSTVPGGCEGNGSINATHIYLHGVPVSTGSAIFSVIRNIATGASDIATTADGTLNWTSATASAKTEHIPTCAAGISGTTFDVKDSAGTAAAYNINVTPSGGTIEGASSFPMSINTQSLIIQCDGVSNWVIL